MGCNQLNRRKWKDPIDKQKNRMLLKHSVFLILKFNMQD